MRETPVTIERLSLTAGSLFEEAGKERNEWRFLLRFTDVQVNQRNTHTHTHRHTRMELLGFMNWNFNSPGNFAGRQNPIVRNRRHWAHFLRSLVSDDWLIRRKFNILSLWGSNYPMHRTRSSVVNAGKCAAMNVTPVTSAGNLPAILSARATSFRS